MRKLRNLKAVRRLLTVLTVSAIVISLFCMTGTLPASAANEATQFFTDKGVATALKLNEFVNGQFPSKVTLGEEGAYTDANGDGEALKFAFTTTNTSKSSKQVIFDGLDPNKTYRVSIRVKADAKGLSGNFWVNFFDTDGSMVQGENGKDLAVNANLSTSTLYSNWTEISTTITPYSSKIKVGFWIKNGTTSATNNVYIDQVVIEENYASYVTSTTNSYTSTGGQIKNSTLNWRDDTKLKTELVAGGVDGNNECIQLNQLKAGGQNTNVTMYGFDPEKEYSVSFWLKSDSRLGWNSNAYTIANGEQKIYWQYTFHRDWVQYTISNVKPGDGGKIQFCIYLANDNAATATGTTVYMDAITVYESATVNVSGATITTTADPDKQDLRFIAETNGYVPANAFDIEYGVYMVRTTKLAELGGELTEELYQANKGVVIKASETVASPSEMPTTINANLKNAVNNSVRCDIAISTRAYVKYSIYSAGTYFDKNGVPTEDSVPKTVTVYAENTSTEGSIVTNGVASRSVYGVAYSIVAEELANGATGLTYDAGTGKYNDGTKDLTNAEVLAFALANIGYLN